MFTIRRFAIALFMVLVLSSITPATAQFGPTSQVYVFAHELDPSGVSVLRVYTTRCTENYQMFFSLSRLEGNGIWVDKPGIIPIGLEPLAPGFTVRRSLNQKLEPGTYKMSITNLSQYGNMNRNVDTSRFCASSLQYYAQTENIVFTVGGGQAEAAPESPVVMTGDQYALLKDRVARFGALLPNATRLIFSQESANGKTQYFVTDQPATPGDFEQISVQLPKSFDRSLPIEVYAKDKSTDSSVSLQVLKPNPVLVTSVADTNR